MVTRASHLLAPFAKTPFKLDCIVKPVVHVLPLYKEQEGEEDPSAWTNLLDAEDKLQIGCALVPAENQSSNSINLCQLDLPEFADWVREAKRTFHLQYARHLGGVMDFRIALCINEWWDQAIKK
ncbi:hypothetical protein BKA83DRAFT_4625505 [Pisolithus microcarpus]|nr:hypothetical protein BKA83DRAFT_4625505 [Pisolithus microcarpus]